MTPELLRIVWGQRIKMEEDDWNHGLTFSSLEDLVYILRRVFLSICNCTHTK